MAKYECNLIGDFNSLLNRIENGILEGGKTVSGDGSNFQIGDVLCAVRVYERYSMNNSVILNVTLIGNGNNLSLSAIASGCSQAVIINLNAKEEKAFLNCLAQIVEDFKRTL